MLGCPNMKFSTYKEFRGVVSCGKCWVAIQELYMYTCRPIVYMYIYIYNTCIYIYIYIYTHAYIHVSDTSTSICMHGATVNTY